LSLAWNGIARVLVVKLGHLGDVLLAAPVVSVLKRRAPHADIDALVYDATAPMLAGHPDLAELHVIGGGELELLRKLRSRSYQLLVGLSDKPRVALLARLTGVRYAVSPLRPDRSRLWRRPAAPPLARRSLSSHVVSTFFATRAGPSAREFFCTCADTDGFTNLRDCGI